LATNFSQSAEVALAGSQKEKDISGIFAYAVRQNVSGDGPFLLVSEFTNYIFYIKIIFTFIKCKLLVLFLTHLNFSTSAII
jgi:hypothetical protein